jgi:hypothetical protein
MPVAHVAGFPLEETLPTAIPLAAVAGWWFRTKARGVVGRLRTRARRSGRGSHRAGDA